ncbi:hypothetical protein HG530_000310 [Fusarium avenaceum]|nr:hypothetical protein HG530_000310 [Fusarium avenaceum]
MASMVPDKTCKSVEGIHDNPNMDDPILEAQTQNKQTVQVSETMNSKSRQKELSSKNPHLSVFNSIKYRPSGMTGKDMGPGPWSVVQGLNAKRSTEAAKR